MGVGAREAVAVERAVVEAEQHLADAVALRLVFLQDPGEGPSGGASHGEDAFRGQLGDRSGHPDEGVVLVAVGEGVHVLGLEEVVALLEHASPHLLEGIGGVEAGGEEGQQRLDRRGDGQVGADGVLDARVLHLHRHLPAVPGGAEVDLAQACRGDGLLTEGGEQLPGVGTELVAEDLADQLSPHRGRRVA